MPFDIAQIRADFPILNEQVNGSPLVYLDNAATTQKPLSVIESISNYYQQYNANIHRGVHFLSQKATDKFEQARDTIQSHFGLTQKYSLIFTSGTTESINLVANGMIDFLEDDDEIIFSEIEHHSNLVPWHLIRRFKRVNFKFLSCQADGTLDLNELEQLISPKTKLISLAHISNALGTIHPIENLSQIAQQHGIPLLVDGAQSVLHQTIDIEQLNLDFFCFSGHKVYAPTGIGVLIAKTDWLQKFAPYKGGGEMIDEVYMDHSTYAGLPHKFEAGTPNIAGVIGLGTAFDYLHQIGMENISQHEHNLLSFATAELKQIEGLRIYGDNETKTSVISFGIDGLHHYDIGSILDQMGIAVRTGHHCAQPLMRKLGISGTVRASFAMYNTKAEINRLVQGVQQASKMLR